MRRRAKTEPVPTEARMVSIWIQMVKVAKTVRERKMEAQRTEMASDNRNYLIHSAMGVMQVGQKGRKMANFTMKMVWQTEQAISRNCTLLRDSSIKKPNCRPIHNSRRPSVDKQIVKSKTQLIYPSLSISRNLVTVLQQGANVINTSPFKVTKNAIRILR